MNLVIARMVSCGVNVFCSSYQFCKAFFSLAHFFSLTHMKSHMKFRNYKTSFSLAIYWVFQSILELKHRESIFASWEIYTIRIVGNLYIRIEAYELFLEILMDKKHNVSIDILDIILDFTIHYTLHYTHRLKFRMFCKHE